MSFLWKNLRARHELIPRSTRIINVLEIPADALRRALVNAVTHRDYLNQGIYVDVEIYDDRVETSYFSMIVHCGSLRGNNEQDCK